MTPVSSPLLSHYDPRRTLHQHIEDVRVAVDAILDLQGGAPWLASWPGELARDLAMLHDLGKASLAFQEYIADPRGWVGASLRKSHTPLSQAMAAVLAERGGWPWAVALAASLAVRGHHGRQPGSCEELLSAFKQTAMAKVIKQQLDTLPVAALEAAVGRGEIASVREALLESELDEAYYAIDDWCEELRAAPLSEASRFRFGARAAYSTLIEADRALLAASAPEIYLRRERVSMPAGLVDELKTGLKSTPLDGLRQRAASDALAGFWAHNEGLLSLTLPTGAGKTLVAARWALEERQPGPEPHPAAPLIVVALPMLSIVDQTERVYRRLLGAGGTESTRVMASHSLSERVYDSELDRGTEDLFLDTWRSETVITTFDQLLLALFSDRPAHAMRYHRLLNARIIIDELQCLPPALWRPVSKALAELTRIGTTRVLTMSATPPRCIEDAIEVLDQPSRLYEGLARYRIVLQHRDSIDLGGLVELATSSALACLERGEKLLVTVNTRSTAQSLWERLAARLEDEDRPRPLLLSGDLTPLHRLAVISELESMDHGVVVSTQCVEAGVDLDVHHVMRDLAPLDAVVQIAGRCNRHGLRDSPGTVTVFRMRGAHGHDDSAIIYDEVLLSRTKEIFGTIDEVVEADVFDLSSRYFAAVADSKDLGAGRLDRFLRLKEPLDVRELLRPEYPNRQTLLVRDQDPEIGDLLTNALVLRDRWARRHALRSVAARLARISVSVPDRVAAALTTEELGPFNLLDPGQYHPVRGLDSRGTTS